jgi:hypothetical protein
MTHAKFGAGGDGLASGNQVDGAKLGRFRRRRMWDADEMNEGIRWTNELAVRVGVERIAGDDLTGGW